MTCRRLRMSCSGPMRMIADAV
ncbi:MAG: hypothetical protein JWL99_4700, partial [Streptomyces oryziradicis]|nr:hypothetical protein [Actinacidiphila oryziradicis]